jgi:RNA-splicing ligase RtcB
VVAEEAEFAYKDLAAVVDMLTASTSPRRVGSFTSIGNVKG